MARLPYEPDALKPLAVSDSGFVFDPRSGHSYNMNGSGLIMLRALRDGRTLPEVADILRESFDGTAPVEDDVETFLARLREYGLIAANNDGSLR